MKTQGGQGDRGHVPTAFNHKNEVGRGGFTKQKDDFMSHSKKTETLAYPEDAIINVESSTEATHRAVAGTNGELDGRTVRISEQTRNVMQLSMLSHLLRPLTEPLLVPMVNLTVAL